MDGMEDKVNELGEQEDQWAHHELVRIPGVEKGFYLRRPKYGRLESVMILSTPEGLLIAGDAAPGLNGVASDKRYGLEWFCQPLSADDLCSKFLRKEWVPVSALMVVRQYAACGVCSLRAAAVELLEACEESGIHETVLSNSADFQRWFAEHVDDCYEGEGLDYNPEDARRLVGIQRAFSRLYRPLPTDH